MAKQSWPTIKKRTYPNGTTGYTVDCRINGSGERLTFKTKAEANTAAEQARVARRNEGHGAFSLSERDRVEAQKCMDALRPFGKSLRDAVDFFLPYLKARNQTCTVAVLVAEVMTAKEGDGKSARYLEDLRSRLGQFEKRFAARMVGEITTAEIDAWLRGLSVGLLTRNNFRRVLRTAFGVALDRGYCLENPVVKAAKAKTVETTPGILTTSQTAKLLAAAPADTVAALAIGAFAGLRRAEVERLEWEDVNLASGFIEVKASKAKSARRRLIKIQPNLAAWLAPLALSSGPVAPVGLRDRLDAAREAAKITEWPSNALRHGFASYHLAHFGNAAGLALEMGHTNAELIFSAYRQIVQPAEAAKFWEIRPATAESGKIVSMVA